MRRPKHLDLFLPVDRRPTRPGTRARVTSTRTTRVILRVDRVRRSTFIGRTTVRRRDICTMCQRVPSSIVLSGPLFTHLRITTVDWTGEAAIPKRWEKREGGE